MTMKTTTEVDARAHALDSRARVACGGGARQRTGRRRGTRRVRSPGFWPWRARAREASGRRFSRSPGGSLAAKKMHNLGSARSPMHGLCARHAAIVMTDPPSSGGLPGWRHNRTSWHRGRKDVIAALLGPPWPEAAQDSADWHRGQKAFLPAADRWWTISRTLRTHSSPAADLFRSVLRCCVPCLRPDGHAMMSESQASMCPPGGVFMTSLLSIPSLRSTTHAAPLIHS